MVGERRRGGRNWTRKLTSPQGRSHESVSHTPLDLHPGHMNVRAYTHESVPLGKAVDWGGTKKRKRKKRNEDFGRARSLVC